MLCWLLLNLSKKDKDNIFSQSVSHSVSELPLANISQFSTGAERVFIRPDRRRIVRMGRVGDLQMRSM